MLILSRRVDEKLLIGKDIVVTVTRIGKQNVRLGIEAPAHVNIVRAELEDDDGGKDQNRRPGNQAGEDDAPAAA